MKDPKCTICEGKHYKTFCRLAPKKPIKVRQALPLPKKRIKTQGKVAIEWKRTRELWFKNFPAEHYLCYICGRYMAKADTTLDHVIPRSRAPHLRYTLSNLKPACFQCNSAKGSVVL